jgi:SAM-dependent methyltransferase
MPDYGLDAPGICRGMLIGGAVGVVLLMGSFVLLGSSGWGVAGSTIGALVALYGLGMGACMIWSSRIGKLRSRERLLDRVHHLRPWSGEEVVLDVGCGRGLMMIGAARRLTTGVAIGVDLWREEDQADNSPDATKENAKRAGVLDRVRVETGDACKLPLPDSSADVVLSHWVIHNLPSEQDRLRALNEMWRVLKPGGVILLADIEHTAEYLRHFITLGASNTSFDDGGWEARVMGVLSGGSYRPQSLLVQRLG